MGTAEYAEDFGEADLISLMANLGYRRPASKPAIARLCRFVDVINADASGTNLRVEVRDYFGRQTRDEIAEGGACPSQADTFPGSSPP